MAEFRDLITLQQNNMVPANRNVGGVLIQKSLERIEAIEGEVLPAIDDNNSKMLAELKKHTKLLEAILNIIRSESVETTREDRQEAQRVEAKQAEVIEQIEENTRPVKPAGKEKDFRLGGIGTAIAMALGAVVGAVQGYIKALKFFGTGLAKAVNWVLDFFPSVRKALVSIRETFVAGVELVKGGFTKGVELIKGVFSNFVTRASKAFESVLGFFKGLFGGEGGMAKIASIFTKIKGAVTAFFEPIFTAFKTIQEASRPVANAVEGVKSFIGKAVSLFDDAINGIKGFFELVGGKMGSFAKIFGATAKIVSKIAFPLTVIMTIWDTVKGAIAGFEKEGVVGAISGAIKGFVNSLIMAPLDMLKKGVSWIVGAFGFDKAEKFLDSFSFEEMFNQFTDALFHPIETLGKLMEGLGEAMDKYIVQPMTQAFKPVTDFFMTLKDSVIGMLQSISIPEIAFTIPVIDKKVSIGPFYPFGKAQPKAAPAAAGAAPAPAASGSTPAAAAPSTSAGGAQPVAAKSSTAAPVQGTQPTPEKAVAEKVTATSPGSQTPTQGGTVVVQTAANPEKPSQGPTRSGQSAQPATAVAAPTAMAAQNVYSRSAQNAGAAQAPAAAGGNVVVAPTTNVSNKTTNNIVRIPSRNNDPTLNEYYKSRYAF